MILGGIPLLALSFWQHDPAVSGHLQDLNSSDWGALFYTSLFGSAISYGVFFYNATRGRQSLPFGSNIDDEMLCFWDILSHLVVTHLSPGSAAFELVKLFMWPCRESNQTELSHLPHPNVCCTIRVSQQLRPWESDWTGVCSNVVRAAPYPFLHTVAVTLVCQKKKID